MDRRIVVDIVNGNTIKITPGWEFSGIHGNEVIIEGIELKPWNNMNYDLINQICISRLNKIVRNKPVHILPIKLEKGKLLCTVKLMGTDLSYYFPEFQKSFTKKTVLKNRKDNNSHDFFGALSSIFSLNILKHK